MLNKSRCSKPALPFIQLNPKAYFVTDDGQPKHRYVQQAAPARHGALKNFLRSNLDDNR